MSVSGTGFSPPVRIDLVPHGLDWCSYRYATPIGSEGQELFMLICADVSACGFQEKSHATRCNGRNGFFLTVLSCGVGFPPVGLPDGRGFESRLRRRPKRRLAYVCAFTG